MFKKIQQRQSSSIPSVPLCTRHPSHQKMASISLPPWIWTGLTTCCNPQNMAEVALVQFQTWPLRRWAASMSSLLDASCHVRNPATWRHSHCEEVWASHAETPYWERKMPNQPRCSIHSNWAAISVNEKDILNILPPATPANNRWSVHLSLTQIAELSEIINCCNFKPLSFGWFVIQQ